VDELVKDRVDIMVVKIQTPALHDPVPPANLDPAIAVV
jgi:hypothetical protein